MTPVVLIVEAQTALREAYARGLRREGYRVMATGSCARAMRLLGQAGVDLLVLDPECERGFGQAVALEALRADPGVTVIFNTSAPQRLATDFSTWMADAYTVRTAEAGELARAARRLLRRSAAIGPRRALGFEAGLGPNAAPRDAAPASPSAKSASRAPLTPRESHEAI